MSVCKITRLDEVESTNTWLKEHAQELGHGDVAVTDNQTAGRGQRGNFWEAEPGKNLTFSLLLHPEGVAPSHQFAISEAVALGVVEVVRSRLAGYVEPEQVKVKWPNDIYVGDDKIAGILIEHTLGSRSITHSVAGVGLNVNQTIFCSSAPNPVSMAQLTGESHFPLEEILQEVCDAILRRIALIGRSEREQEKQHTEFLRCMWRNDGEMHRFMLPDTSCFAAMVDGVDADGMLRLKLQGGEIHKFAFKEVAFL